jgi:hypothetical protein
MPSASLQHWQNDRMPRLAEVDAQCSASLALVPPNPHLVDENLRAYVVLLSAHFQGFCRDLYTEPAQIIASKVRPSLQLLIRAQFSAHRALDHGNPNADNITRDFNLKRELGLVRAMGVVGAAMRVVTAGGRFPAFLAMAPLSFQRPSSFPCIRRHAETNFLS